VFAWGGDGMVRRCINEMAGTKTRLAVLPAGTSNLFARSLDIPSDIAGAVEVGLHGVGREVDVGTFNGERFGVMAGAGFDAAMIRTAMRSRSISGARPTSSAASATTTPSRLSPRSTSTASGGTRGPRRASCSGTSASSSAASRSSRTRGPTTGCWSWAS